jgi:hypothetical protein
MPDQCSHGNNGGLNEDAFYKNNYNKASVNASITSKTSENKVANVSKDEESGKISGSKSGKSYKHKNGFAYGPAVLYNKPTLIPPSKYDNCSRTQHKKTKVPFERRKKKPGLDMNVSGDYSKLMELNVAKVDYFDTVTKPYASFTFYIKTTGS